MESDGDAPIDLSWVVFTPGTDFIGVVFERDVDFQGARFREGAYFDSAQFLGAVRFVNIVFDGPASFSGTVFNDEVVFRGARFGGAASYLGSKFLADVSFMGAEFALEAYFANARFEGSAEFHEVKFSEDANFRDTDFTQARYVSFTRCEVTKSLNFHHASFPSVGSSALVRFHYISPEHAERIRFEGVRFDRVSFLRTNVSKMELVGCTWAKKNGRNIIFDELALGEVKEQVLFDETEEKPELQLVAEQYRQLRLNFEANRQEVEAGDFYVGQMEMRRRDRESFPKYYRRMLLGYRWIANYGESYLRPPIFFFGLASVFAALYLWGGFQVSESAGSREVQYGFGWPSSLVFGQDFLRALAHALTAGGFVGGKMVTASWWVPLVRFINMVADTLLVALFAVALRRRFHR